MESKVKRPAQDQTFTPVPCAHLAATRNSHLTTDIKSEGGFTFIRREGKKDVAVGIRVVARSGSPDWAKLGYRQELHTGNGKQEISRGPLPVSDHTKDIKSKDIKSKDIKSTNDIRSTEQMPARPGCLRGASRFSSRAHQRALSFARSFPRSHPILIYKGGTSRPQQADDSVAASTSQSGRGI